MCFCELYELCEGKHTSLYNEVQYIKKSATKNGDSGVNTAEQQIKLELMPIND
jgi:hypothetical protein|tara:strand:- start:313 stop:471 length:159 start_codon:yes stop_codon:yes gene_type:complete